MAAWYSVVQHLPNPIIGECINLGVFAFDRERVLHHFLCDWSRVRAFTGRSEADMASLKAIAQEMAGWDLATVRRMAERDYCWSTVRLTKPRGSVRDVEGLLAFAAGYFLAEPDRCP